MSNPEKSKLMEPENLRRLLLDASQFIAGAVADGYGNQRKAHRIAQQLATVAGEGREMAQALSRVIDCKKLPENVPSGFAKKLQESTRRVCLGKLFDGLAALKTELVETARLRRRAGDESAELAFLSAAERLVEVVREQLPEPAPQEG